MDTTPNLELPYILAAQSQKHVTHNEALRKLDAVVQIAIEDRDLSTPPATPADGARYIVAQPAQGGWTGHETQVAAWQDGAWTFYAPAEGWLAWVADEDALVAFDGSAWIAAGGGAASVNPVAMVGINATADSVNRLSVAAQATLLTHDGGGHQLKLNKAAAAETASLLFQTGYSGRAEMGLTGDDDYHFKVSSNGTTWAEAIVIDRTTGAVSFPNTEPAGSVWTDATNAPFGASGNGVADDHAAIQAALDAAGGAGGGTVYLPPGTYLCSNTLAVPSHVTLTGCGFASVIRNPAGALPGKTLSGVTAYASIIMIGVTRAQVSNLCLDHATHASLANGIQIGESGAAVRSADCAVEGCKVLGHNAHQYLIYSKCADRTRLIGNTVVGTQGALATNTDLAGIEVYGGIGVEVCGNNVSKCSGPGIVLQQETSTADSDLRAIDVHDNRVEVCTNGIQIAGAASRSLLDISVHHNTVSNCANRGIMLAVAPGAIAQNVQIHGNTVKNSATYDIVVENTSTGAAGVVVSDNVMSNDMTAAVCFYTNGRDMQVLGNMVSGQPGVAYYLDGANNVALVANTCTGANGVALLCDNSTDVIFLNNMLTNYGKSGATNGILARTGSNIRCAGNYFKYAVASAVAIDAQSCTNVEMQDNILGWTSENSLFLGGNASGVTKVNWHPGVLLPGAGNKHVSAGFRRPVAFGGVSNQVPEKPVDIMYDNLCLRWPLPPAAANAAGTIGEIAWDAGYIYVCTGNNAWKRAALSTW